MLSRYSKEDFFKAYEDKKVPTEKKTHEAAKFLFSPHENVIMKIAVENNEKMNSGQICDEQTKLIDTMLFVFYRPRERERERERENS